MFSPSKVTHPQPQTAKTSIVLGVVLVTMLVAGAILGGSSSHSMTSPDTRMNTLSTEEGTMEQPDLVKCAARLHRYEQVNHCFVDMPMVDEKSKVYEWHEKDGVNKIVQATSDAMRRGLTRFGCTVSRKFAVPTKNLLVMIYPDKTTVAIDGESCIIKGVYHTKRDLTSKQETMHPTARKLVEDAQALDMSKTTIEVKEDVWGWAQIPSSLQFKNVAIAATGQIYGVTTLGLVYVISAFDALPWELIPGLLTQISVSTDGRTVAGVNALHQIFYRLGVDPVNKVTGTSWRLVWGSLKDISVGNTTWGVNLFDQIYVQDMNSDQWHQVDGSLRQISAHGSNTVGTDKNDNIFQYRNGWHKYPGSATWASMGEDGSFWIIGSDGSTIYRYDSTQNRFNIVAGSLSQIDVANGQNVVGVNVHGDVFVWKNLRSDLVSRFAPVLSFPRQTLGYPADAGKYFNKLWINGQPGVTYTNCKFHDITEQKTFDPRAMVTYYRVGKCGDRVAINYKWFYGMQHPCIHAVGCGALGWHGGDWEQITIVLNAAQNAVEKVRFHQHSGYYERLRQGIQFYGGRVKVYVGWWAHGSYDTNRAPPIQGVQTCMYYGDLVSLGNPYLWGTVYSKMVDLISRPEPWMNESNSAVCQVGEKTRPGLGYFCGVFGQMDPNGVKNMCQGASCGADGCYRNGLTCSTDDDCVKRKDVLGIVQQISGRVACCQGVCQDKKMNWAGLWQCPHDCRGGPFMGLGTC